MPSRPMTRWEAWLPGAVIAIISFNRFPGGVCGLTYGGGRLANVAGCHVLRGRGFAIYGPRTTERSLEQINEPLPSRTRHATHPARL
jgi:hypothetical protein